VTTSVDQIAASLQGYDPKSLRADHVSAFLQRLIEPVREVEQVGIFDALGRVLAEDLISPISVPPHDNSAMDGFAFDGAALAQGTALSLKIVGTALAGAPWQGRVGSGEALKIMTGAVMPDGLDTVVPQELAREQGDRVTIAAGVLARGDNRRKLGEDLMQGQPALRRGDRMDPAALGLVASLGMVQVPVWRRLKVAIFSTGNEILSLGEAPRAGAVYDSNRYTVYGLLTRLGVQVIDMGVVPDEPSQLESAFARAAREADAVITSGGVSVGEADYTKAMMHKLAGDSGGVVFWRIAMRPGRPMAVGRIKGGEGPQPRSAVLFGLPGNPVAVMVTFLAFVRPALLQMMGSLEPPIPMLRAHSQEAIRKKAGRTEYQRGIVSAAPHGSLQVRTTGNQGSGVLSSMVQANGLIVLGHDQGNVAVGDEVDVMVFAGVI